MKASKLLEVAASLAAAPAFGEGKNGNNTPKSEQEIRGDVYERMMFFYNKLLIDFEHVKDDEFPKPATGAPR